MLIMRGESTDISDERFKGAASSETNARWLNEEVSGFSYHKSSLYLLYNRYSSAGHTSQALASCHE